MNQKIDRSGLTPEGLVSFAYVWGEPELYNSKYSYRLDLLFPKDVDLSALEGLAYQAFLDQWPSGTPEQWYAMNPFKDGDTVTCSIADTRVKKEVYPQYVGTRFLVLKKIGAKGQKPLRPLIFYPRVEGADAIEIPEESQDAFYAGCIAIAHVSFSAYDFGGTNVGIGVYYNALMLVHQGERLGGAAVSPNVFPQLPPGTVPAPQQQQVPPAPGYPAPVPQQQVPPAPGYPAPVPQQQVPPAPGYPAPGYPAPGYPAPGYPAPGYPAPVSQQQVPPAPGYPAPVPQQIKQPWQK